MKRLLQLVLYILSFAIALPAVAENPSWSLGITAKDSKVLGGSGINIYNKPFLEGLLTASFENGFFVDIYHSTTFNRCFENGNCGGIQEWDLESGWAGKVSENWKLFTNASYFSLGHFDKAKGDAIQLTGKVTYTSWLIQPYLQVKYVDLVRDGQGGGFITHLGGESIISLSGSWSLPISADLTHDGLPIEENGYLWRVSAKAVYSFSVDTRMFAGVEGYIPLSEFKDRKGEAVPLLGFSHNF